MDSDSQSRVGDLLVASARELVEALDGVGCAVSRAIGDLLVLIAEHTVDGRTLQLGQGYLISDYPETKAVLEHRLPLQLSLQDEQVDPAEAALLREYGFDALLMLPLEVSGEIWGLVEVYRKGKQPFSAADIETAGRIVAATAERLQGF